MNHNKDNARRFSGNDVESVNFNDLGSDGAESSNFLKEFDASLNFSHTMEPPGNVRRRSMEQPNSNTSFNQNSSSQAEHWRNFEGGRETSQPPRRNPTTRYHSLGEQRANANRQYFSQGRRQNNRRKTGRGRGRASSGPGVRYRTQNLPNKEEDLEIWSGKSGSSGQYSDVESVHSSSSNPTTSSETRHSLEEKFQSLNINSYSGPCFSETIERENSIPPIPSPVSNLADTMSTDTPRVAETFSSASNFLKVKEAYERELRRLQPAEVIMDCRQLVEVLAKDVVSQNLKKIERFRSSLTPETNTKVAKRHLENLVLQQEEFDKFVTKVKGNLSSIFYSDIHELVNYSDLTREEVENESRLFKKSLPAYAHKSSILNKIAENQVTIICADAPYSLNTVLPIFVKKEFKNHFLISCERSEVLKEALKNNVLHLVKNKIGVKDNVENHFNSEFKFLTVDELGKTFLEDYTFSEKNSLIILNLPLKRSLILDIVLCDIRDLLRNQVEAKLILLIPKVEKADAYEMYFSETSVGVLCLPSLTLPVTTVWKQSSLLPTDDYINEVLKTVLSIHILDKSGDIMAFLPSHSDTKIAAANLRKKINILQFKELNCELVHEKSLNKACLSLFNKQSSAKQTVYFVTDCAEMMILPSVMHIIDCGLRKELMFDSTKKLDVMTTTFISCSKARLRKSLAGIYRSGICYRLYSKNDYEKEMPLYELPELLTVNPFNSLITIFHYRKDLAAEDEFVESLPENTKENALSLLKKAGALKNNKLTEIGKNIVKLPFPARYSKFILMGIEWGIGYDVIMLVAFFQEKGSLFQNFSDPEKQKVVDAMKVQLSKNDSDALNFLHIFRSWQENDKNKFWSDKYCVNLETLRSIENRGKEICVILGDCLQENVTMSLSDSFDYETCVDILFECFKDNLGVFSGHHKSGYRVLSSHCFAFLHPSSVVCSIQDPPQFILFDQMHCADRDYLLNITIVPPDLVMKALGEQTIDFDYSDMYEKSLVQKTIEPVSERIIKQMLLGKKGKKLKVIEDYVRKQLSTDSIVIEPIPEKGKVLVFALESLIDKAVKMVQCIIDIQLDGITKAEEIKVLELKRGQTKLPVEVRWSKGAHVASVKVCDAGSVSSPSTYNVEENDEEPPCQIQRCVSIKWVRRRCTGYGFVTYNGKDFLLACRRLAMKTFKFNDAEVFMQRSKKYDHQLYIQGLPPDTDKKDLELFLKSLLPGVIIGDLELEFHPPYETSERDILDIKQNIMQNCRNFAKLINFNVVVPYPEATDPTMSAFVTVTEDDDVNLVAESLSKSKLNKVKLNCTPVYRSIIKCSITVSGALEPRLREMLPNLNADLDSKFGPSDHFTFEIIKIDEDFVAIKMLSKNLETLELLLRNVNNLLEGELLDKNFSKKIDKIFCHGGHMWLKQTLEKSCNVYVIEDNIAKTLRLYGSKENCAAAKEKVKLFLEDTDNDGMKFISLSREGTRKKLLKAVILEYGVNLEKLIESTGLRTAVLDIKHSTLALHGGRTNIEEAEECLRQLTCEEIDSEQLASLLEDEENCPVCSCAAYNLSFRLELCGHLYCSECIQALIDLANFPIQCAECSAPLSLDDIHKVLGDEKVDKLVEKSLRKYIDENRISLYCCPAPDCSMFFQKDDIKTHKIHCPLCQNDICTKCNVVFHQGYSCDMYQGSKDDPDYSFKVWQSNEKDCKQCPNCHHAIERFAGCDHMHCQKCSAHFCWICLKEFETSRLVYEHLPFCPKHPKW